VSEVFRVVEVSNPGVRKWASRPYETIGAARNRASALNNSERAFRDQYRNQNFVPRKYVVEVLEGDWELADG
jgi:hypothetical protein